MQGATAGAPAQWLRTTGAPEPGRKRPYGQAFHPVGRRVLVVGHMDQPTRELDGDSVRWTAPGLELAT